MLRKFKFSVYLDGTVELDDDKFPAEVRDIQGYVNTVVTAASVNNEGAPRITIDSLDHNISRVETLIK